MMNGKTIFGLLAGLMLVFVLAWPLSAAEQPFELTIPGKPEPMTETPFPYR
jgi:hypothetical protein